jgi:post-segregation antitoxin (ccd killing protein)
MYKGRQAGTRVREERSGENLATTTGDNLPDGIRFPPDAERTTGETGCAAECVILCGTMKSRAGKTVTFSISVDEETQRILRAEAKRSYGGNVSALVAAVAKEAKRQSALDWLLQRSGTPPMTEAERKALLAEIDGAPASKKRPRGAA